MPTQKPTLIKYFSDYNGEHREITREEVSNGFHTIPVEEFRRLFPGIKGTGPDAYKRNVVTIWLPRKSLLENGESLTLPITRHIWYVSQLPSLHKCDARCRHGKPGGRCECSCGGLHHGTGE